MNTFSFKTAKFYTILIIFFLHFNIVKAQNVTLSEDSKFEQLLSEKRKLNSSITVNNQYKIQIFNGSSDESKKVLIQFKRENKNLDGTIVFSTPAYKVWVGNFKTRIDAERNLNSLKKKFPNAIIIKPNR